VNGETIFFRCDAIPRMGTGHVMRCLGLAQAWQDEGGRCVFLSAAGETLLTRLSEEGFEVRRWDRPFPDPADLDRIREALAKEPGTWLVLDGYHFDQAYQQALRDAGTRLLVVDDEGLLPLYHADVILNQNLHADAVPYKAPGAVRLLGTRFALLRREFGRWQDWQHAIPAKARKVLVTMGGADADNVTLKVIQALGQLAGNDWEAVVVVGLANSHAASLRKAIREIPFPVRLEEASPDVAPLMAWADIAVAAAGSTSWELCFMTLPSVLVELAANQTGLARALHDRGVAMNAGWYAQVQPAALAETVAALAEDAPRRAAFARAGRDLVDGRGAHRVVETLRRKDPALLVRRAGDDDCRPIWEWANDPTTRAASFSPEAIPWQRHIDWFTKKLGEPSCYFYVVTDIRRQPIGMVRYDTQEKEAVVSINIAPAQRGRGLGAEALRASARRLFDESDVRTVLALVKPENRVSVAAFERAGYRLLHAITVDGQEALRFGLNREDDKA
jgi:UDP-2,4-diacetamido-2,4,6-trideoxy-beta-L-altropyranose hydrolase